MLAGGFNFVQKKDSVIVVVVDDDDDDDDNDDDIVSKIFRCAGCSYNVYQGPLSESGRLTSQNVSVNAHLHLEPQNLVDKNAIAFQLFVNDSWCSTGYVYVENIPIVYSALQNNELKSVFLHHIQSKYHPAVYYL